MLRDYYWACKHKPLQISVFISTWNNGCVYNYVLYSQFQLTEVNKSKIICWWTIFPLLLQWKRGWAQNHIRMIAGPFSDACHLSKTTMLPPPLLLLFFLVCIHICSLVHVCDWKTICRRNVISFINLWLCSLMCRMLCFLSRFNLNKQVESLLIILKSTKYMLIC